MSRNLPTPKPRPLPPGLTRLLEATRAAERATGGNPDPLPGAPVTRITKEVQRWRPTAQPNQVETDLIKLAPDKHVERIPGGKGIADRWRVVSHG